MNTDNIVKSDDVITEVAELGWVVVMVDWVEAVPAVGTLSVGVNFWAGVFVISDIVVLGISDVAGVIISVVVVIISGNFVVVVASVGGFVKSSVIVVISIVVLEIVGFVERSVLVLGTSVDTSSLIAVDVTSSWTLVEILMLVEVSAGDSGTIVGLCVFIEFSSTGGFCELTGLSGATVLSSLFWLLLSTTWGAALKIIWKTFFKNV